MIGVTKALEGLSCPMCQQAELEVLEDLLQCPECNWRMWREVAHRPLKESEIRALIQDGETKLLHGFTAKSGKSFSAILTLDDEGEVKFRFPPRPEFDATTLGKCPLCGGDVIEREKAYSCANWKENHCEFAIWKDQAGHALKRDEAQSLLRGNTIGPFAMKSRQGKSFRAKLRLDKDEGKVAYEFIDGGLSAGGVSAGSSSSRSRR